ncbi:MAG: hypothetical protein LBH87_03100 [Coriobacteriales bacterium]|jgi:hypothetical protein|nr:hypothetical protein [Coriobacteriales bacterium]
MPLLTIAHSGIGTIASCRYSTVLKFADTYTSSDKFINLFYKKASEQLEADVYTYLDSSRESVQQYLRNIDQQPTGAFSYYTATEIGISVPAIHAIGDHLEIEFSYSEMKEFKK